MEPHYCKYAYRKNGDVSLHCRYLTEKGARQGKKADWTDAAFVPI